MVGVRQLVRLLVQHCSHLDSGLEAEELVLVPFPLTDRLAFLSVGGENDQDRSSRCREDGYTVEVHRQRRAKRRDGMGRMDGTKGRKHCFHAPSGVCAANEAGETSRNRFDAPRYR